MKKTLKVWVVEMWCDIHERWEPTIGCALTREDGRNSALPDWQEACPDDRFRLVKYTR